MGYQVAVLLCDLSPCSTIGLLRDLVEQLPPKKPAQNHRVHGCVRASLHYICVMLACMHLYACMVLVHGGAIRCKSALYRRHAHRDVDLQLKMQVLLASYACVSHSISMLHVAFPCHWMLVSLEWNYVNAEHGAHCGAIE